ncbi:MAG TPA: Lpg1974 family pore-forming outer membrane protein [Chlamydiales bacterium]|nr:Lpg1974 family pore-forming outer membrane protein [Chlamydiales bacterium]
MRIRIVLLLLVIHVGMFSVEKSQELIAQCCLSKEMPCCYPEGYHVPAAIHTECSWNMFADASFIYWYAKESGLSLAESSVFSTGANLLPVNGRLLQQSFEYHPGFKVGLGTVYDQTWVIHAEYVRLSGSTHIDREAPENRSSIPGFGVWSVEDWFQQTSNGQSLTGSSVGSKWEFDFNLIDLACSYPYYLAKDLTVTPISGLRAIILNQHVDVSLTETAATVGGMPNLLVDQPIHSRNHSKAWGIGPRIGCMAAHNIWCDLRAIIQSSASLLWMDFTTLKHSEDRFSLGVPTGPFTVEQDGDHQLRPNFEIGLGLGWGAYSCEKRIHWDVAATYDFSYFWGQNAIRQMLDTYWVGMGGYGGDLYFHGLTLTAKLDF